MIMAIYQKAFNDWPEGKQWVFFPETLDVPRGQAESNIEVEAKQNSLFPGESVIKSPCP